MYDDRSGGSLVEVTVAHVSTTCNVPAGEEPEISIRMQDGNVKESLLARLQPLSAQRQGGRYPMDPGAAGSEINLADSDSD